MIRPSMAIILILGTVAFVLPAVAQGQTSAAVRLGTGDAVVQGNRTIVFAPAGTSNIDGSQLRSWGEFAETHPAIAKSLAYNSSLIDDGAYLLKHPELDSFCQTHLDIKDAMVTNPGNFVAIQPRPGE
jgi:hypothetical protein